MNKILSTSIACALVSPALAQQPGDWPMPAVTTVEPEPLDVYRAGLDRFIALGDAAVERLQSAQNTS